MKQKTFYLILGIFAGVLIILSLVSIFVISPYVQNQALLLEKRASNNRNLVDGEGKKETCVKDKVDNNKDNKVSDDYPVGEIPPKSLPADYAKYKSIPFTTLEKSDGMTNGMIAELSKDFQKQDRLTGVLISLLDTKEKFDEVWSPIHKNEDPAFYPLPEGTNPSLDLSKEIVIGAIDSLKGSGGYSLEIKSVKALGNKLFVEIERKSPCGMASAVMTMPYHLVKVEKGSYGEVGYVVKEMKCF